MAGQLRTWKLHKYARHEWATGGKRDVQAEWKLFEDSRGELTMALTGQHHLVITQDSIIQENISLWNCQCWMKGIHKGDSLLIIYKFREDSRRFRVKFSAAGERSGLQQCTECVQQLQKYFPVKRLSADGQECTKTVAESAITLTEQIPVGNLAQSLLSVGKAVLPLAYQHTNIPSDELGTCLHLCLTDTNFPAFVANIEDQLKETAQGLQDGSHGQPQAGRKL